MKVSETELTEFAAILSGLNLEKNVEYCVAILWRESLAEPLAKVSASELAKVVHNLGLTPALNIQRTFEQLSAHPATQKVAVGKQKHFRIAAGKMSTLTAAYGPLLKHKPLPESDSVIDLDAIPTSLGLARSVSQEMNHAYDCGCYNSCAVLMRRLVEGLLVTAFEKSENAPSIMKGKDYMMLEGILGVVKSGSAIKLSRGKDKILDEVKTIGDHGAHSRTFFVRKPEIDDLKLRYRTLVAELVSKC